jgi:UPF0755 protein
LHGYTVRGLCRKDRAFTVPDGAGLTVVAAKRNAKGRSIPPRAAFPCQVDAGRGGIKAGEFLLPKGASEQQILAIITGDQVLRRFVTIAEGLPSIMVKEKLMANPDLVGAIEARRRARIARHL